MPLSNYKGSSTASLPATSGENPYEVTLVGPVPPTAPTTVTVASSPYQVGTDSVELLVNTSGGAVQITLPASPTDGQIVGVKRITTDGNTLTVARNGKNIEGAASNFVDGNIGLSFYQFQYDNASSGWWLI